MPAESNSNERQVLIADSDKDFAESLAERLRQRNFEVRICAPSETTRTLREFSPYVVLCDIEGMGSPNANLPADIQKVRSDIICVPMARRPDLRQAATPFGETAFAFVNKYQKLDAAVDIVDYWFKKRDLQALSLAQPSDQTQAAIEEAKCARLEFLAKVSHELRTPLNAIIGFSELIKHDVLGPIGNEQYRSYIEDIHSSGRHLLDIINDILDFAKAEAGKLVLQESEVDIQDVVDSIKRLLGPRARDAGIDLIDSLPKDLPHLWCDERKLKQMLLNLLSNAVKFTPSGGRIDLEANASENGLMIVVHDTGVGIAESDLDRVMQPFVQADNTSSRPHEGTGLGLPLVKAMVEIHGGTISLESELTKGTTVTLTFPPERLAVRRDAYEGPCETSPDRSRARSRAKG